MAGTISVDRLIQQIEMKIKGQNKIKKTQTQFTSLNKVIGKTTKKVRGMGKELQGAIFQFGIGALFAGMALKRLGLGIIKSLVETYTKATDSQNIFFQKLQGVQAAFEFLKFSIFDALSQSELVISLIDGFIQLTNWVSKFVAKHPLLAKLFVAFAIGAIIMGTALQVLGQFVLGLLIFDAALVITPKLLFKVTKAFKRFAGFILITAIPAVKNFGRVIFNAMVIASRGVLAFLANPVVLLAIAFITLIVFIFKLKEAMGGWFEVAKSIFRGMVRMAAITGTAFFQFLLKPLIDSLKAAKALAKFLKDDKSALVLETSIRLFDLITEASEASKIALIEGVQAFAPAARTEEEVTGQLFTNLGGFKAAIGATTGALATELQIENVQNNEITIETTDTEDIESLSQKLKDVLTQTNEEFLEEQIIRLEGTTRGT